MRTYLVDFSVPWVHGWQRAGVNGRTRVHFKRSRTATDEQEIAMAYRSACNVQYGHLVSAPRGVPVSLHVDVFAAPPKRYPAYLPRWLKPRVPFVTKPDADNIAKLMDGLNGVAWADDAQVTSLVVRKHDRNLHDANKTTFAVTWTEGEEWET